MQILIDSTIRPNTKKTSEQDEISGFLRKLASVVAQIYTTFSKIAENSRIEINKLEIKYEGSWKKQAEILKSKGNFGVITATASIAIFAIGLTFANPGDRAFVKLMSEHVPNACQIFNSRYEANQKQHEAVGQLAYQQIQDKSNKTQSEGNLKDQFAQVLQAEIQRLRSASAQTGG